MGKQEKGSGLVVMGLVPFVVQIRAGSGVLLWSRRELGDLELRGADTTYRIAGGVCLDASGGYRTSRSRHGELLGGSLYRQGGPQDQWPRWYEMMVARIGENVLLKV